MKNKNDNSFEKFVEWSTQFWWPIAMIMAILFLIYNV